MSRALSRARRLAGKRPGYLARRVAQEARREGARVQLARAARGSGPVAPGRVPGGLDRALATTAAVAPQLLAPGAAQATAADSGLADRLAERTGRAAAGRWELFGDEPLPAGEPPRWLEDVRSGQGWEPGYHQRIDYVNRDRSSDVKVAWELSRLRNAVTLAQALAVREDSALRARLERDLASWHEANPVGWTVNWASAMEVALRAVNLVCIDAILLGAGRPLSDRALVVGSLYRHGWFLARHLEISDVNGNHFLADAVGLVWLGRYLEGIGEAARWTRTGLAMVREAAREQVLADGLDHEGSLPYHVLVLEMFLAARHAAGEPLMEIDPQIRSMLEVLAAFTGPDGRVPDLGDDDGGRVLALADTPSRCARRVLALGAALTTHEAAAARAGRSEAEDVLWLRGPEALAKLPERAAPVPTGPRRLSNGGLVLLGGGDDLVAVDAGPVGFRGRGGHGHLDAMSPEAVLGGRLAVRDSGTGSYTGDPGLRNRLRDAPAHSVVLVDGRRYARIGEGEADPLWRVEGDSPPEVVALEGDPSAQRAVLRQRLPAAQGEALHERTLRWQPGALDIHDRITAPAGARIEAFLHVPPGGEERVQVDGPGEPVVETVPWSQRYGSVQEGMRLAVRAEAGAEPVEIRWRLGAR